MAEAHVVNVANNGAVADLLPRNFPFASGTQRCIAPLGQLQRLSTSSRLFKEAPDCPQHLLPMRSELAPSSVAVAPAAVLAAQRCHTLCVLLNERNEPTHASALRGALRNAMAASKGASARRPHGVSPKRRRKLRSAWRWRSTAQPLASSASGDDIYVTLGWTGGEEAAMKEPNLSEKVQASFNQKMRDAERRGDSAAAQKLRSAKDSHDWKMLALRASGQVNIPDEVKHADKKRNVLPSWLPKPAPVSRQYALLNLGVSLAVTGWAFASKHSGLAPLTAALAFYFIRIFTTKYDPENTSERFRFGRALALPFGTLAVSATAVGYLPVKVAQALKLKLPVAFLLQQRLLVIAASAMALYATCTHFG